MRRESSASRKAGAASSRGANAAARKPEAEHKRAVEVCCSSDSLMGAEKDVPECEVLRIAEQDDLNNPDTWKQITARCKDRRRPRNPVLVWAGGPAWSHVNPSLDGNRD